MNKKTVVLALMSALVISGVTYSVAKKHKKGKAETEAKADSNVIKQTIVNIEYRGSKVWVPSFLIFPLGAEVELKLVNKAPSGVHGFSIPKYNIKVDVSNKKPAIVKFKADEVGLSPVTCHIHPAHVGGQLLIVDVK